MTVGASRHSLYVTKMHITGTDCQHTPFIITTTRARDIHCCPFSAVGIAPNCPFDPSVPCILHCRVSANTTLY